MILSPRQNDQVRDAYEVIKLHAPRFQNYVPLSTFDVLFLNGEDVTLKIFGMLRHVI